MVVAVLLRFIDREVKVIKCISRIKSSFKETLCPCIGASRHRIIPNAKTARLLIAHFLRKSPVSFSFSRIDQVANNSVGNV